MTNNDEMALKEDWRDDYEKIFPIPEGMERTASYGDGISTGYINKSCFIALATVYLHRWAGYKVGREALLAEREADKEEIAMLQSRNRRLEGIITAAEKRIADMQAIADAAEKLVRCKGRYHSEQNYRVLAALFGVTTPDLPPLETEARTVCVKLPVVPRQHETLKLCLEPSDGYGMQKGAEYMRDEIIKVLAAAGINLEVGE